MNNQDNPENDNFPNNENLDTSNDNSKSTEEEDKVTSSTDSSVNSEDTNGSEPKNNPPKGDEGKVDPRAKAYWKEGNALFEDDKYDEAIEKYNQALSIDPRYIDAYFNRGLTERIQNKFEEAKNDLKKVILLQPDSYDAPLLIGDIEESQKNYIEAEMWYRRSLASNPNYGEAKEKLENVKILIQKMNESDLLPQKDNSNNTSSPNLNTGNSSEESDSDLDKLSEELNNLQSNSNPQSSSNPIGNNEDEDKEEIEEGQIKKVKFHKSTKTFKDVVGEEKLKRYLYENVVLAIRNPELFKKYGKKLGVGLLMYGPPGTGKTYTVDAIAGEAQANVIIARTNQIVDMYTGNTEKNLHAIFEQARNHTPCIIFFDELDALGVKRGGGDSGGGEGSALRLAVNQFLVEMNGVEDNPEGLFVIGATNQPWDIDPALKRSGRFGDSLYLPPPNYKERKGVFRFYTKDKPKKRINYGRLARATEGYSPADIQRICDKAVMIPLLKEYNLHKQTKLTTGDILKVIKGKVDENVGSSLDEWYSMVKKDVISKTETRTVNGKKETTVKEGKLDAQEKILYKSMVKDIKKNTSSLHIMGRNFDRWFAIHLF